MKMNILKRDFDLYRATVKRNDDRRYYVYFHHLESNDKIIYVGKGCRYRGANIEYRNKSWNMVYQNNPIYMSLYKTDLTKEEAYQLEIDTIKMIGLDNLINVSEGGMEIDFFRDKHFYGILNGNYGNKYGKNSLSIAIVKLDMKGNLLKEYSSISEVVIDGFNSTSVCACCNNKRHQLKGFQWMNKSDYVESNDYSFKRALTSKLQIDCFDINGNHIKTYESINATSKDGFLSKNVQQVLKGKKKSHKKFIFKIHTA
jgi:hypothetical protein